MRRLDLDRLAGSGVDYMTVNCSHRLFPGRAIPYHAVSDLACYADYAAEIEAADVALRLYRAEILALPAFRLHGQPKTSVAIPSRRGGLLKRGPQRDITRGLGNDGSVMTFAAQIAWAMGHAPIVLVGCDLTYREPADYAYDASEADRLHAQAAVDRRKRLQIDDVNAEFAILRRAMASSGVALLNATVGGRLESLPRVEFDDVLSREAESA
jgi:hypothetical protein